MNYRTLITQALINNAPLAIDAGDRVFQYNSVPNGVLNPYLMVKFAAEVPEPGWRRGPSNRPFAVWAYDQLGDFTRIDRMLEQVKVVLQAIPNSQEFMEIRFLDTSPDFDDAVLGAIYRYSRFQLTTSV